MALQTDYRALRCRDCVNGEALGFDFTMGFQPIVNVRTDSLFAFEALVRSPGSDSAAEVFRHVNDSNLYRFDQTCRVKAIQRASELGFSCDLSINFLPNAIYRPELCIRTTLAAAERFNFDRRRIIFEVAESEKIADLKHVQAIIACYKSHGFKIAIDDFGAGYAGLNLLAELHADIVKLDMGLIRSIELSKRRQAIVRGIVSACSELNTVVIAEGVETCDELKALGNLGIECFQGFYFGKATLNAEYVPHTAAATS